MITTIRFKTAIFQPTAAELDESHEDFINPGVFARELADFLKAGLCSRGYEISSRCSEDWGYWQQVEHDRGYTLAIGCANLDDSGDGPIVHRVFVEPDKPIIRPSSLWFRKIDVQDDVETLVAAIADLLRSDNRIQEVTMDDS